MLIFSQNMTGAQFDSAAQAQLQQHDKFQYQQGSPNGNGGGAASSSSAQSSSGSNVPVGPTTPTHYVVAQHAYSGGGASVDSGSGLNVSLQLLSKYDAPDSADGRPSASPKLGAAGDEEPKTHDRRLL